MIQKLVAVCAAIVFLGGCEPSPDRTQKTQPPNTAAMTSETGRYQIVFSPHVRADTFLLDTKTGEIWQMQVRADLTGEPTTWERMLREDNSTDEKDLEGSFPPKQKPH